MIFAQGARQAGAAFVNGPGGDNEPGKARARAVRSLFGQVSVNDKGIHNNKGKTG
jgi:catalase (peroxidase I)